MGIHEWLLKRGYRYEVVDELKQWLQEYKDTSAFAGRNFCGELDISEPVAFRSIAPTGTIGIIAGTTTGIEPLFAVAYKRRYLKHGSKWHFEYVIDSTAEELITRYGLQPEEIETSATLAADPERRIKFQFEVQKFVDMAISSTINLPEWGTELNNEDKVFEFASLLAKYAEGLRGFTCYPNGARGGQPLTEVSYEKAKKNRNVVFEENDICTISGKGGVCGV